MNEYVLRIAVPEQYDLVEMGLTDIEQLLVDGEFELLEIEEA